MTVGEKIKNLRIEKGISQRELASLIDMSQQGIAFIESNRRNPSQKTIEKMANLFNLPTSYFFDTDNIDKYKVSSTLNSSFNQLLSLINEHLSGNNKDNLYLSLFAYISELNSILHLLDTNIEICIENSLIPAENISFFIRCMELLNTDGQDECLKRILELTEIKRYTEKNDIDK